MQTHVPAVILLDVLPARPPELVTLGKPDLGPAHDARAIADYARQRLTPN